MTTRLDVKQLRAQVDEEKFRSFIRGQICPHCNRPVRFRYVFIEVQVNCECGFAFGDFNTEFTKANKF